MGDGPTAHSGEPTGRPLRPPVIGLTGGIGAGKSAVAKMLSDLGCYVVHSDRLAHEALRDPAIRETLLDWWGREIIDADGELDRSAIGAIVFDAPGERRRLEGLVHPWIERRRKAMFATAPSDAKALVIDAPLLLEAGLERECAAVIFVDAGYETRLRRVRAERGWSSEDLARRDRAQMPLDEKRSRADHTVVNEGDLQSLQRTVRQTLDDILDTLRR